MMMMVMVALMVNMCDDDCVLVKKVILVKEVMSCDVSPVAMSLFKKKRKIACWRWGVAGAEGSRLQFEPGIEKP